MTTATLATWASALTQIGFDQSAITEDLTSSLSAHDITPVTLNDESFQGFFHGESESEAGMNVAREFAALNELQWFLRSAVNWEQAWQAIKQREGYTLIPTTTEKGWALFYTKNR